MKSIVIEIKDEFAAVLSDDGCITKVKNHNYTIGQVIKLKKHTTYKTKKLVACAATAAILLIGLGGGTWAYASPYSYVSLDVNPSIEFTVNRFDRVLSVKAVNNDGEEILKGIQLSDLENQTISQALSTTVGQIAEQGYFDGNTEGGVVIATSAENTEKSEELAVELQESVENTLEETGDVVEVEAISVGLERVKEAAELGVTPGKLNLVQKLIASSADPDSIVLEDWLNKPVKEIMSAIKANKEAAKAGNTESDETPTEDDASTTEEATTATSEGDSVTGETDSAEKLAEDEKTAEELAADKAVKAEEKASKDAEKASDKTVKDVNKATSNFVKDADKAIKEADKAIKEEDKASDKAVKATEKNAEQAKKDAKKAAVSADKIAVKEEDAKNQSGQETDKKKADKNTDIPSVTEKATTNENKQDVTDDSSSKDNSSDKTENESKTTSTNQSDKNDTKSSGNDNKSKGDN